MTTPTIISYSNIGYHVFAKNLLVNIASTLVNHRIKFYCLDEEICKELNAFVEFNKNHFQFAEGQLEIIPHYENLKIEGLRNFQNYGTAEYNKITHTKMDILLDALEKYGWIHFVDCDVVFMKEPPIEFYNKYETYDIVYQPDVDPGRPFNTWICTGNVSIRNTPNSVRFLNEIKQCQTRQNSGNDQDCQRLVFDEAQITDIRDYPHARLFEYPPENYTCGYNIMHNLVDRNQVMVFHANHVTGGDAKIELLKKMGKWYF